MMTYRKGDLVELKPVRIDEVYPHGRYKVEIGDEDYAIIDITAIDRLHTRTLARGDTVRISGLYNQKHYKVLHVEGEWALIQELLDATLPPAVYITSALEHVE